MDNIINFFPNNENRTVVAKFHYSKIVKVETYNKGKKTKTVYQVQSDKNPFWPGSIMNTFTKLADARRYMKSHTSY